METSSPSLPLVGVKVLELGAFIAGPFAAKTLADFGAEVIKIEPPGVGDPLRKWRLLDESGTSLWWQVQARNKKSVALDLHTAEGQNVVRELMKLVDVVIENFRPGKLEEWNLGWEQASALNPQLIMLRISGYGQTGPYRDRAGFGVVGEAMGGLRHLSGEPGRAPVRVGISIGDSLASLHGLIGLLMALYHRDVHGGGGQMIDVALYESVFNMMESTLPEYDRCGVIREPSGASLPGIAPTNAYICKDGSYLLIAGNGDGIFKRLMKVIDRQDLADDLGLKHNDGRVARVGELDAAITAWTVTQSLDEALEKLNAASVPAGRVYTIKDIVEDPQYQAREMICDMPTADGRTLKVPGIVPKLSATPGQIRSPGPTLGQHTAEVLAQLGITAETPASGK